MFNSMLRINLSALILIAATQAVPVPRNAHPLVPRLDRGSLTLRKSTTVDGQAALLIYRPSQSQSPFNQTDSSVTPSSYGPMATSQPAAPLVAAYYPDWGADILSPEDVDFSRIDWIDFAFAIPDDKFQLQFSGQSSKDLLWRLVATAHAAGKKVKLSVGGWDGSTHFSKAVSTEANRKTFVNNMLRAYKEFELDGIDIDWEYPGVEGHPGNVISPQDSANFLQFLHELRAALPPTAKISAATQVWPFANDKGDPMADASAFAKVLDWVLLMNYDVWGSSSTPGANAPLDNACGNSSQPVSNAKAAIESWTKAGFPANKILMGVPSYAYISRSVATRLHDRRDGVARGLSRSQVLAYPASQWKTHAPPPGLSAASLMIPIKFSPQQPASDPLLTNSGSGLSVQNEDGGTADGQVQFRSLIEQGALKAQQGSYVGAGGFTRHWDECSSTPFLRSATAEQVITYDDPQSLELKAKLVRETGVLGVNMFDAHGDTTDWELIDSLRRGLGLPAVGPRRLRR